MTDLHPTLLASGFAANALDAVVHAEAADVAFDRIDVLRRVVAGDGIFSINLNVTTARDPRNEVRLQRLYSSVADAFPVRGGKRKTLTPWTETLFVQGRPFIGEGAEALAQTFDDYERMRAFGVQRVLNVPLMRGPLCYATFNVFGTRSHWQPHELLGLRLLALAAARWISPAPDLAYAFDAPAREPAHA
jgi:hypothetical protein